MRLGLTSEELQAEISRRLTLLDEAQADEEHLGQYGELMRMMAVIAFQRAADLIAVNNRRIEEQLKAAGVDLNASALAQSSDASLMGNAEE
ncbi:MAG TPA: hypothetical protein VFL82_04770 [Thermomicrobiales bacterium]|nr:hypothetical protein [Thermomicrobiales bacterium]